MGACLCVCMCERVHVRVCVHVCSLLLGNPNMKDRYLIAR